MKYKGIELKEFTSEKPVIFDPPKRMMVWNDCDSGPSEANVFAFIPNRCYPVIGNDNSFDHCAEIPDKGSELATNRELAKWLAHGNGQLHTSGFCSVWTAFSYDIGHDDDACSKFIRVRKWGDTEWHKPTREYLGLED